MNEKSRTDKEIIRLHRRIVVARNSLPLDKLRDEHLRGWEKALLWVMIQEEPPTEVSQKDLGGWLMFETEITFCGDLFGELVSGLFCSFFSIVTRFVRLCLLAGLLG